MSGKTLTASPYTPDRFRRLLTTLNEKGLHFPDGPSGEVKDFGADVKFNYDEPSQTLTLDVLHGPHFHNFDDFCQKLTDFILAQE